MAATVVGAVLSAVTQNVVEQVFKLVAKGCERWQGFPASDIDFIKREMMMIAAAEEDHLSGKGAPSAVKIISMEEMRDLAHDIQDCLDRILRYAEGEDETSLHYRLWGNGGRPGRLGSSVCTLHRAQATQGAAQGCTSTKSRLQRQWQPTGGRVLIDVPSGRHGHGHGDDQQGRTSGHRQAEAGASRAAPPRHRGPTRARPESDLHRGSGKSTLAKALYGCPDVISQFPCRAWVVASQYRGNTNGFLTALLKKLRRRPGDRAARGQHVHRVRHDIRQQLLATKRYLIVFDGIEEEQWDCIKFILPENTGGRVIVTTRTQTVAEICCNHGSNGYVYNMPSLDEKHSKDLLQVVLRRPLLGLEQSSRLIVNKCDGHRLTLFSVANYLQRKSEFTETDCKKFWSGLDFYMAKECTFRKLQKILLNSYRGLPADPVNLKTCLLYVCVFPNGRPIKRSSLFRRWLAEGYVQDPDPCKAVEVADKILEELIDRNIIRPIKPSKNAKVKTCRAHGIIHEFMLRMSISAKFITSLCDPQKSNYRHLFMNENPETSRGMVSDVSHCRHTFPGLGGRPGNEKLRAHSLTICGSAGEDVVDFANCELLRVLDLEECKDLKDYHMDSIHKLWHLKYLSLGATISRLPRQIEKLHCLETLDMTKARVEILPVEVLKLPYLAHLLGKFKLEKRDWKMSELGKFLPKESNLQTLAGFVTDGNPGFPMLMVRMKRLRKVKIWCNDDDHSKMLVELMAAIKKFVEDESDTSIGVRSLSLHLGDSTGNFLHSLENSFGYLSSLKLHGALGLSGLIQFSTSLCGLTELCLSTTYNSNLMSNGISNLRKLIHLKHLKLVKVSLEAFAIRRQDFPRLLRLSLVQNLTLPTIEEGALQNLISLQLLNERLCDLAGIEIRRHQHLQEVALDSDIKQEAKTVWEDAAKKHPKRPTVLYLKRVYPQRTGSMVKYIAPETECSSMQEERKNPSDEEQTLALTDVNSAGPSMASTELPSARNDGLTACSTRSSILMEAQGLQSSRNKVMFDQELLVGMLQEEKAKPDAEKNKDVISLNSQYPNFDGLKQGKRSQSADDHGTMKESNYHTDYEDDGEDKKYKRHKSFSGYEKAMPGVVIKETAVHGFRSAVKIRAVDNYGGSGNSKMDEIPENIIQVTKDREFGSEATKIGGKTQ